jgi:putative membrane protein
MMFWPDHDVSGWGWAAMSVTMVLIWGLIIAGAVLLIRALNRSTSGSARREPATPKELLAERFARGEIDEEEYQRRLAVLTASDLAAHLR